MRQLKITRQVTNRDSESLDKYLKDIGKIRLLTHKKEIEFARAIKENSNKRVIKTAAQRLIEANLRFVVSVAKKYQNQGLSLGDLINEGNLGLIKAASRFDHTKGFKFISYAVWWIRQSIMQALAELSRCVRQPTNKIVLSNKINKTATHLEQKLQRTPSIREIAENLNLLEKSVEESIKNSVRQISMDAPLVDREDSNLYDVIRHEEYTRPDRSLDQEYLRKEIERALNTTLNDRERLVITLHFGLGGSPPMTLEEVGKVCDLTRERVRQIETCGLKKLRHSSARNLLVPYLGD